ncbi:MAG: site-2 protease family protein [Oscillospiraceae bacterium]|nr:site-2 protease family protein [Oscillospiraceae bacterium]
MLRRGRMEITGGFVLLMAWLNYSDTQGLLPLGVCAAAAHEVGHWLAIRLFGAGVSRLRLSATGAQMQLVGTLTYPAELCCALAGPAVNLLLGYAAARLGWLVFAGMNLALGLFNLLPVGALDGGRVLRCLWCMLSDPDRADGAQLRLDRVLAVVLLLLGAMALGVGGSVTLCVIGSWLFWTSTKKYTEKWQKKYLSREHGTGKIICIDLYGLDACCHEPNPGTDFTKGTKTRPLHRRRI